MSKVIEEKNENDKVFLEMKNRYDDLTDQLSKKDEHIIKFGDKSTKLKEQLDASPIFFKISV